MSEEKFIVSTVKLSFCYAAGASASRFFREMRDHQKIFGTPCPTCKKVWVPARSICSECQVPIHQWIELPPTGCLVGWTGKIAEGLGLLTCLVQLKGAHSLLVHRLGEYQAWQLKAELRIEPVWNEQRTGSILDIAYFRPIKTGK